VIIPALNAERTLPSLLDSLERQTYPPDRFEVIVVDNGSSDRTARLAMGREVVLLHETEVRRPGVARNRGLTVARGEVLAFLDADCVALPSWLETGVAALEREEAGIVAGRVEWTFSSRRSASEIFDSLVHLRNDIHVQRDRTAVTANLFVRRQVFDVIGHFPHHRSGEDSVFVLRAQDAGFTLRYAPDAVVRHPARTFWRIMAKAIRVGLHYDDVSRARGRPLREEVTTCARAAIPCSPRHALQLIRARGTSDMEPYAFRVWLVSYAYAHVWGMASTLSILRGRFLGRSRGRSTHSGPPSDSASAS
jgi:glycosyltransferase involved in cell wall biosynthesis